MTDHEIPRRKLKTQIEGTTVSTGKAIGNIIKKEMIGETICYLFIVLFVYAATSKLFDFDKFKTQIGQSPLLTNFSDVVAWGIPALEILLAGTLFFSRLRLLSLYGCFGLMVIFSAYILVLTKFSDFIPCSCGGILEGMSWNQHLIFNCVFVVIAAVGVFLHPNPLIVRKHLN